MSWLKGHQRAGVALAIALALVIGAAGSVIAASVIKSGKSVTAVKTVTSADYTNTQSTTYVDVPGFSTTISVPATQQALLIITFSAPTECVKTSLEAAEADCLVRILVDGAAVTSAETVMRSGRQITTSGFTGAGWTANSMQFVRGPLSAGSHTVNVQWKVFNYSGTSEFQLDGASLTILRSRV
jgi:hypothetical protein